MTSNKLFLQCVILVYYTVSAFNVDYKNYAIFNLQGSSMFGFTVAVHKESNRGWVLVGAPEAHSQYQHLVDRSGAVYKCRTEEDNRCEEVPFDKEPNSKPIDSKENQWFGATLTTSGAADGPVVACAPRYIWFTKEQNRRDPVGTCYVSDGYFNKVEEYSPCRTIMWGYHRQGSCQAGFSAAINSIGDRLYVGAPGSYYWQGQMYSIDAHASFNFTPGVFQQTFGATGSVRQKSLETRPAVFSTREGEQRDDDSYMGYSTVVGKFTDAEEQGIAVGMPRAAGLYGKVLIFTWNLNNYKNISCTSQIGSYFGYALAAADVDGDKKLDLIVGAPLHTEVNTEGKYDVGRVYVLYQKGGFDEKHFIDGFNSKSRFGHSLASLGDMNQDGYDDFAVGAPYDGKQERGAVYIYYGSAKGVREKYGQVIYAETVMSNLGQPLNTFGFSLSGGIDLDGNEYPDMAVGAYLSDTAFFFRSKPVVRVDASVLFHTQNKQIDLKQMNCALPNNQRATCTSIDFCVKYGGKGIPQSIYLNLQYILDTKKHTTPRMAFLEHGSNTFNETIMLHKDRGQICKTKQVYIKGDIRDKLTPLEAEVKYAMTEDASYTSRRDPRSVLTPILDLNSPPSEKDSIIVQKNCGFDNICIPNLHINVTTNVEKYLLGSNTNLAFDVIVSNFGEDSFETTFELKYPEGIYFRKIELKPNMHGILCSPSENRTIKCDIGNPLPAKKIASFIILLQPYHKDGMAPSYEFDMYVNSTNPEDMSTMEDNHKHVSIDIWIDSSIELTGKSHPANLFFNATSYSSTEAGIKRETDIGPQVTHVYYLRNKGPATIQEAEMFFMWPYATLGDEDFLYLLDQPHTLGNVKCDAAPSNYKHYQLDYIRSIWERLDIDTSSGEYSELHGDRDGVAIESGAGIQGVVGGPKSQSPNKLDEEISSSGDASFVHQHRHETTRFQGGSNKSYQGGGSFGRGGQSWQQSGSTQGWRQSGGAQDWQQSGGGSRQGGSFQNNSRQTIVHHGGSSGQGGQTFQGGYQRGGSAEAGSGSFSSSNQDSKIIGSTGRITEDGNIITYKSRWHTETVNGQPITRWVNTTTITDSKGNVIKTYDTTGDFQGVVNRGQNVDSSQNINYSIQNRQRLNEGEQRINEGRVRYSSGETNRQHSGEADYSISGGTPAVVAGQYPGGQGYRAHKAGDFNWEGQSASRSGQQGSGGSGGSYQYGENRGTHQQQGGSVSYHGGSSGGYSGQVQGQHSQGTYGSGSGPTGTGYYDEFGVFHSSSSSSSAQNASSSSGQSTGHKTTYGELDLQGHSGIRGEPVGFTVTTFDLGTGGGVDLSGNIQGRGQGAASSGTVTHTQQGHNGAQSAGSGGRGRQEWTEEHHWSTSGEIPPTYFNTVDEVPRDNVPTDKPNLNNLYRGKRQTDPSLDPAYTEIKNLVQCKATKCFYVRCVVGMLEKDKEVSVALRSRLNARVVKGMSSPTQPVKFSSMMLGRISKLPYIGTPRERYLQSKEIITEIPAQEPELKPSVVPLWVVVLSAVAGTLILLLLIFLLYKLGFFKRNRPSNAPERQPLNRNGYHHGDEAL